MTPAGRLRWATDIHLDHLSVSEALAFAGDLFSGLTSDDAVVVTGDISSSTRLMNHLRIIDEASQQACDVPWCFVLGNHDYYGARIADVRADVCGFVMPATYRSAWLGADTSCVALPGAVLIGVDGWADARAGNPMTPVLMSDFQYIDDLADAMVDGSILNWRRGADRKRLHAKLRELADAEGAMLKSQLDAALAADGSGEGSAGSAARRVVVATHLPPWSSAAWHDGRISSRDWQTYFVSVAIGRVIEAAARVHPDVRFAVLCGHTHGSGVTAVLPNLRCHTGAARYGRPEVQATFDLSTPEADGLFSLDITPRGE